MAAFMKEMREGFRDIRSDIATNNAKMDNINSNVETLEKLSKSNEKKARKDIDNVREEISENQETIEKNVTSNVIESLKPKITDMQSFVSCNIRRIVK